MLFLFFVLFATARAEPSPCLLRCKDDHMFQVQKSLGDVAESSSEFLFPVETILRSSPSYTDVVKRVDLNCRLNVDYHVCLTICPRSKEQKLLVMGLKPWMYMCKTGSEPNIRNYLPCLWTNTDVLEHSCFREMNKLKSVFMTLMNVKTWQVQNFRHLCGTLYQYDDCYLRNVAGKCGRDTARFLQGLADVNNSTLLELFSFDQSLLKMLPPECFKERTQSFQIKRDQQSNFTQSPQPLMKGGNSNSFENNDDLTDIGKSWGARNVAHKTYCSFSGAIVACIFSVLSWSIQFIRYSFN